MTTATTYFKENMKYSNRAKKNNSNSIKWCRPSYPFVKINFDGSILNSVAAGGYVIRNEQ